MNRQEFLSKIQQVIDRGPETAHLPGTAPIVAMFAENFMPTIPPAASGDNMTSREIVEVLEDICQLTVTDVAMVMSYLGFRLYVNSYNGHEWAMTAADESYQQ